MKFGVREICDVVFKAKTTQKIGQKVFYKNEPVIYFDSLKTSNLEQQSNTVYAQGGRGNTRLIAWDGDRTVTFTMEDALISPIGVAILTGAGLIEASSARPIYLHRTERTNAVKVTANGTGNSATTTVTISLSEKPYFPDLTRVVGENDAPTTWTRQGVSTWGKRDDFMYVMLLDSNNEVVSEPYIPNELTITEASASSLGAGIGTSSTQLSDIVYEITLTNNDSASDDTARQNDLSVFTDQCVVLVDYYVEKTSDTFEVNITPESFGTNFYLEASTLFRDTNGVDMPAEFVIPNCRVQSNFTFTMASSGDPSTFTFTMDAFPDYTRWDPGKKVIAAIQVLNTSDARKDFERLGTPHDQNPAYATTQKDIIEGKRNGAQ